MPFAYSAAYIGGSFLPPEVLRLPADMQSADVNGIEKFLSQENEPLS
jgi:hypothetical protein